MDRFGISLTGVDAVRALGFVRPSSNNCLVNMEVYGLPHIIGVDAYHPVGNSQGGKANSWQAFVLSRFQQTGQRVVIEWGEWRRVR